jgi:hypothetical protein
MTIDVLVSSIIPQQLPCPLILGFAFGFYIFTTWRFLQCMSAPLGFVVWIVVNLLCSCPCLFKAIVELHLMDEEVFKKFSYWKVTLDYICNKGPFIS